MADLAQIKIGEGHVFHGRGDEIKNQFRYPSFFLHFRCDQVGELHSVFRARGKFFLSFRIEDYLEGKTGALDSVVREFLRERCGYEAEEVWLQTMPRMFGYAFNPVSFWLCRRRGELEAVLVEVNNTFGERHFYWLKADCLEGKWVEARKIFHVSPFQPVEGFYRFRFSFSTTFAAVEIYYYGSNGRLRLKTWLRGKLSPLADRHGWEILGKYGWMTPLVVVRIHLQAFVLYCKKANYFRKPSPPIQEVS